MRELTIDGRRIADDTDCFVIAEIGHNHQGSVEKAQELFVLAKHAGVDAVKLQKRDNRRLFTRELYDSPYDNENSFGTTYGAHREALELDRGAYAELQAMARELGLVFFATAFDEPSADLLEALDAPAFKIASGDLTQHAAPAPCCVVREAAARLDGWGDDRGRRPRGRGGHGDQPTALPAAVHRRVPRRGREAEPRRDHHAPRALPGARGRALRPPGRDRDGARRVHARRARDREALHARATRAKGTDHAFSLMPEGMRKLVRDLHRVPAAIGDGVKRPLPSEEAPLRKMGKKLVAARRSPAGHVLVDGDLVAKSPADGGLPPYRLDDLLGLPLVRPLAEDEAILADDVRGDPASGMAQPAASSAATR